MDQRDVAPHHDSAVGFSRQADDEIELLAHRAKLPILIAWEEKLHPPDLVAANVQPLSGKRAADVVDHPRDEIARLRKLQIELFVSTPRTLRVRIGCEMRISLRCEKSFAMSDDV